MMIVHGIALALTAACRLLADGAEVLRDLAVDPAVMKPIPGGQFPSLRLAAGRAGKGELPFVPAGYERSPLLPAPGALRAVAVSRNGAAAFIGR